MRYRNATDVLPKELIGRCNAALDGHRTIITFKETGPLTAVEQKVGDYALQIRDILSSAPTPENARRPRSLYFAGHRQKMERPNIKRDRAKLLLENGHSLRAVSDALQVHRTTVAAWCRGVSVALRGRPKKQQFEIEDIVLGVNILQEKMDVELSGDIEHDLNTLSEMLKTTPTKLKRRAAKAAIATRALEQLLTK